jgi:hypothetical protein
MFASRLYLIHHQHSENGGYTNTVPQKAVDSGEVVDWKNPCCKVPRVVSGENIEVSCKQFPVGE